MKTFHFCSIRSSVYSTGIGVFVLIGASGFLAKNVMAECSGDYEDCIQINKDGSNRKVKEKLLKAKSDNPLSVKLRPQETGMWCWAASAEMVIEYSGKSVTQCEQANWRLGLSDCCNNPTPDQCIVGGWPEFSKYGFSAQKTSSGTALTWNQLKNEISQNRPVAFSWAWTGGGGHMMVVNGFLTVTGQQFVSIQDPWPPNEGEQRDIPYAEFVKGNDHSHWIDFYRIKKANTNIATLDKSLGKLDKAPKEIPFSPLQVVSLSDAVQQSRSVAIESVKTYKELEFQKNGTGAASMPVDLGQPFAMVRMGLDELRNIPNEKAAEISNLDSDRALYPIQENLIVKSSVTIQKKDGGWKDVAYGNKALTKLLVNYRKQYAEKNNIQISEFFVFSVPALNTHFVAVKSNDKTIFIPIIDDPRLNLKAGNAEPATTVIPRLKDAAKKHNGLPS